MTFVGQPWPHRVFQNSTKVIWTHFKEPQKLYLAVSKPALLAAGSDENTKASVIWKTSNTHNRVVPRHQHGTRAASGVSRGFGNLAMKPIFNFSALQYNKLPAKMREPTSLASFKNQLRTWVEQNIDV